MVLIFGILGSIISRFHGGGFVSSVPKVYKNILWALPFAGATFYITHNYYLIIPASALCLLKCLGHGRGFRLHEPMAPFSEPELVEKIIPEWLPIYWYKVAIMTTTGLAAVSGAAICIAGYHPLAGAVIAVGGAAKGLAYMIGEEVTSKYPTEIGELLTGFFAFAALYAGVFYFG